MPIVQVHNLKISWNFQTQMAAQCKNIYHLNPKFPKFMVPFSKKIMFHQLLCRLIWVIFLSTIKRVKITELTRVKRRSSSVNFPIFDDSASKIHNCFVIEISIISCMFDVNKKLEFLSMCRYPSIREFYNSFDSTKLFLFLEDTKI